MAKSGEWNIPFGMWLSSMVLMPIGAFLTYKANKDSVVFNMEAYQSFFRKLFGLRESRHLARKEVVIDEPCYPEVKEKLAQLDDLCRTYAESHKLKRLPNYIEIFFRESTDKEMDRICNLLEDIVAELANSRSSAVLDSVNNLPVIQPQAHCRPFAHKTLNKTAGIIFPIGFVLFFRIWRYRIRLERDLAGIRSTANRLQQIIAQL